MKFILNNDNLSVENENCLNSGSIKFYEADIEYDEIWNDLIIEAKMAKKELGQIEDVGESISIIDNKIYIDKNISGMYAVGFIGYTLEYNMTTDTEINKDKTYYIKSGDVYIKVEHPVKADIGTYYEATKTYQISTNLVVVSFNLGAGELKSENSAEIPTATEWEIYIEQLQTITSTITGLSDDLTAQVQEVETKLENGDFDGADGITPTIGENGDWYLGDVDTGKPSRGENGTNGTDGFSPIVNVTQTGSGATISITDKVGTTTANISNGQNGINGVDGFSPIATVTQTQNGATISITDKEGTTTANISNGQNGQNGYTPVRGTDYWTAQDISYMEQYCANYIDANITQAIGGSY